MGLLIQPSSIDTFAAKAGISVQAEHGPTAPVSFTAPTLPGPASPTGNLARSFFISKIPGGTVVRTLYFHCRGHRFDPQLGNEDPTSHSVAKKK